MNAIDTKLLVRLLTRDDERQAQRARRLLAAAEAQNAPLFVPDVVVLELIWVLASAYRFTRTEILAALEMLADLPVLRFQSHDVVRRLVRLGRTSRTDLSDLLIGLSAAAQGCRATHTFDRRLVRQELFAPVP